MQQYKIRISELAEQDLENAGDYIAFELLNPIAAENMVKGIREQINKLEVFPASYELDDDPILAEVEYIKHTIKNTRYFTL